jgi:hypothetical protein
MKASGTATLPFLLLAWALSLPSAWADPLAWKRITGPEGGDIQALTASGDTVVAVTAQGDYYRSDNGGKAWTLLFRELSAPGYTGWAPSPVFLGDRVLGSAAGGGLLVFQGGRADRILPELPYQYTPFRPYAFNRLGNRLFALSSGMYVSLDSGKTWTLQVDFLGGTGPISAMANDGAYLFAMNGGVDLFASPDQGLTWSSIRQDLGRTATFGGLTGMPGGLLAWWQNGESLRLRRQGDSLVSVSAKLPGQGPWTVGFIGGKLLASGSQGISQSPDGGLTWTPLTAAPPLPIQAMAELPGGGFLAGTREGLYLWSPLTRAWSLSQTGCAAVEIRQLEQQGNSLLALANRSLHRSPDGGATWHRISAPGVSAFTKLAWLPPDLLVFDDSGKIFLVGPGDTLGEEISREFPAPPLDLGRSGKHWVYMDAKGATRISHDDRKTWSSVGDFVWSGYRSRMAMQDSRIIIQSAWDSLRYSSDTGHTWKIALSPSRQNLQLALSGNAWLAVGGQLYRSEDPAAGWQPVAIGTLGAVPARVVGNGKSLYAITDIGLYASMDDGATWESAYTGMLRGEFETLRAGATALCAKAEGGTWWLAGLDGTSPTRALARASTFVSPWPRLLRSRARSEDAILDFRLEDRARLYAFPMAANGKQLAPALRKEFEAGAQEWILPRMGSEVFWRIEAESPRRHGGPIR